MFLARWDSRLPLFVAVVAFVTFFIVSTGQKSFGQVHVWDAADGFWSDPQNWDGGDVPDTIIEWADFNANGSYTIDYIGQNLSIAGIIWSDASANLVIANSIGSHASLTLGNDLLVRGHMRLDNNFSGLTSSLICNGTITNSSIGTIFFGGTNTSPTAVRSFQADTFINEGIVHVQQNTQFDKTDGIYANNGTFNINPSATLTFGVNNTFNQNAGTLNNQGAMLLNGDTFNFNDGNIVGNAIGLHDSTLNMSSPGTGEFNTTGSGGFSGDIASGQIVNLLGTAFAHNSTNVTGDVEISGVLNLTSDFDAISATMADGGTITNKLNGTVNFDGASSHINSIRSIQAATFDNLGVINVDQNARLNRANGIVNNEGAINIASGASLKLENQVTFNQNAGTVDNQGQFALLNDTLNFNGGNFLGNGVDLRNSKLNISAASTGSGTFNLTGLATYSGDLRAGQFLNLKSILTAHQQTTVVGNFENQSVVNLASDFDGLAVTMTSDDTITNAQTGIVNFGGTSNHINSIRSIQAATFDNLGVINVDQNARLNRSNGIVNNEGTINIANGKSLKLENQVTFNQNTGTVDNQGQFALLNDTLNFNGGNFLGNGIDLRNSTLNIAAASTGSGTFNLTGLATYSGDLRSGQFLNLNTLLTAHQQTTVVGDFQNQSVVNLNSDFDGLAVTMTSGDTITNTQNGIVNFGGTSNHINSIRSIQAATFDNLGVVNVNQSARLNRANGIVNNEGAINIANGKSLQLQNGVTFNQNAGTVDNQGQFALVNDTLNFNGGNFLGNGIDLHNSTLNIAAASTGTGTFNLTGNATFNGDLHVGQNLNLLTNPFAHQITTAQTDFTNSGSINFLPSDDSIDTIFIRAGLLTNNSDGLILFSGSAVDPSTARVLRAEVYNLGEIEIATSNISVEFGNSNATHSVNHVNSGHFINRDSDWVVLGDSFTNEVGGIISGEGTFNFDDTGLVNAGIIDPGFSAGHLEFEGTIDFEPTSILRIELGGTLASEFDSITVLDDLLLDGNLDVSFIDGFQHAVADSDTFLIIDSNNTTGMFAGLSNGDRFATSDGLGSFQINYNGNDVLLGNFIATVPEPGSFGTVAAALMIFLLTPRRKRIASTKNW